MRLATVNFSHAEETKTVRLIVRESIASRVADRFERVISGAIIILTCDDNFCEAFS